MDIDGVEIQIANKVVPGQPIVPELDQEQSQENKIKIIKKFEAGPGCRLSDIGGVKVIASTIAGEVLVKEAKEEKQDNGIIVKTYSISVANSKQNVNTIKLPKEGDTVLAKVMKISARQANLEILCIEDQGNIGDFLQLFNDSPQVLAHTVSSSNLFLNSFTHELNENFKGIVRTQDIRLTERDKINMLECFHPGDIVRAKVINMGDGSNYYLSTASNELGVVLSKDEIGNYMYPLDYETMVLNVTGEISKRKVAKPF